MATTNRIAARTLTQGASISQALLPAAENITLRLTTLVPFGAAVTVPQTLMVVRDAVSGQVRGSLITTGANTSQLFIDNMQTNSLVVDVLQLYGTSVVQVDEITGMPARTGAALLDLTEVATGLITTAKFSGGAATLPKWSAFNTIKCLAFVGAPAAGPIACVGTAVGDRALMYFGVTTLTGGGLNARALTVFEATISVINQVQQTLAADLSLQTFIVLLAPAAA